jgi:penicillin-binding protein 2
MRKVVTDGSGRWYADLEDVPTAGKTGTAQNPHGMDHAWFISFAPLDDPQIAVAVLVENAGFGSVSAAPIASLMIEKYMTGEIKRQWIYDRMLNFEPEPEEEEQDENTGNESETTAEVVQQP